jgi:glycosyltransferase involved in cell wall biosynthesis
MNPDRFASLEEQIFLLTRAFGEEGGFFLPLFICDHRTGNPPVYAEACMRAECMDLHRFRLHTLLHLVRLIRRDCIDVIHWNFTQPLTNPYLWALSILTPRVKHYFTDHMSRQAPPARGLKRFLKRALSKRYSKVFGVSHFVVQCLRQQGWSVNLAARHHFLNTDRFKPDPMVREILRRELNAIADFVVIFVGYLVRSKGTDIAIRALRHLPTIVKLWVVGSGEDLEWLKSLAEEEGVAERVRFFGHRADVERYIQAADCLICPSRGGEAAGLVNLEAQACGLPVIGSRIGGIPEYIQECRTGFLFTPEDHRELAMQIGRLVDDRPMRQQMQAHAHAWTTETFSHTRQIESFLDIYRSGPVA